MTGPVIDHLDAFEAEIVALAIADIEATRAKEDAIRAAMDRWRDLMRSPACRRVFGDYAEANFRRTGGR